MFLADVIDNAAAAEPGSIALVTDGRRWSFAELQQETRTAAARLTELTEPGERVAVVSENTAGYVAALYGVPLAGCVLTFVNTRHTPAEILRTLDRSGATVVMGSSEQVERLRGCLPASVRHRMCFDTERLPVDIERPPAGLPHRTAPADDSALAWLLFTSGTTGAPKGAMLTHRSILAAALNTTTGRPIADDDVYLFPFPLFHVAAYNVVHHHLRRRPVVLPARFDALELMEAIQSEGVTSVSLAPTMLAMVLDHPERDRFDLSSLRQISYGAAAMPRELLRRCLEQLPEVGLAQGYGMTELSGNAVFLTPEEHRRAIRDDPELLTAAGRPGALVALRIADDDDRDSPAGEPGEILVRGDQVCAGYWEDPDATAAAIVNGWLHTGDVGRIDERGYLHVMDRKKDVIITGGENVSSREVEDTLGSHPGVKAVAVVGVAHATWGEQVVAIVVPEDPAAPPSLGDLRSTCAALAGFKHPRAVVLVESLPLNTSGKVDKVALRALTETRLAATRA